MLIKILKLMEYIWFAWKYFLFRILNSAFFSIRRYCKEWQRFNFTRLYFLRKRQRETCQSSLIRDDCSGALCGRRIMLPLPKRTLLAGLADSPDEPPANLSMSSALVYLKNAHSLLETDQHSNLYFHVLICLSYVCLCKNCPNEAER